MFFECQWLILFQAENICFLPPVALTQSTLKSVGIVLLTSKPFRSSPVPSVVYNFIVKYHRTGNICFKLFFLSFATLKKKPTQSEIKMLCKIHCWMSGTKQAAGSAPQMARRLRYKYCLAFCFKTKVTSPRKHSSPPARSSDRGAGDQSCCILALCHRLSSSRSADQHLSKYNAEPERGPLKPQLESEKNTCFKHLS